MVWFIYHTTGILYSILYWFAIIQTYIAIFTIFIDMSISHSLLQKLNYLIFTMWFILSIYSHLLCVFTDPGSIPLGYDKINYDLIHNDERNLLQNKEIHTEKNKQLFAIFDRQCEICNCVKPPRTHHCSICNRCIARLDHHCPWTNNCVGFYTQRPFLQLLLYSNIFAIHALIIMSISILYGIVEFNFTEPLFSLFSIFTNSQKNAKKY